MSTNEERDNSGRPPGAPAWDGDLSVLSPQGLEQHSNGVAALIANLTTKYGVLDSPPWRVTTPEERRAADFEKWVARLVEARNERHRREKQIGGVGEYMSLLSSPAADQSWTRN